MSDRFEWKGENVLSSRLGVGSEVVLGWFGLGE